MLESILNSKKKEQILFYLLANNEGYAREIARFYNSSISPIQNQLESLELGNLLVSKTVGRTRLYFFNPRYPFLKELKSLLDKAVLFLPQKDKDKLYISRKRPRRKGKQL